jgi:putative phosphoribosyl transferase
LLLNLYIIQAVSVWRNGELNSLIFERFAQYFHFRFKDRTAAAIALSDVLDGIIKKPDRNRSLIVAIPRGGVVTADTISERLSIKNFDIVISKKLTDPDNKEQAIGAVIEDSFTLILEDLVKDLQISNDYLKKEIAYQTLQIDIRKRKYFQNLESDMLPSKLRYCDTILLVDDGIATGASMIVTVKWLRQFCVDSGLDRKRVIIAVPVAPKNIVERIRNQYTVEVVTLFQPFLSSFRSVEQYYQNFEQIPDERVIEIINERIIKHYFP